MNATPVFKLLESTNKIRSSSALRKCRRFVETSASAETNFVRAKAFECIPRPTLSHLLSADFIKLTFGKYENINYLEIHKKLHEEFGALIRLPAIPVKNVLVYDPNYIETLYRNEPIWPRRDGFDYVNHYLKGVDTDDYANGGIFFKNGPDWHAIRSSVNKTMMQPRSAQKYVKPIEEVTADFIDRIRMIRQPNKEMPENFDGELRKWALEGIGVITLDTRFGCLKGDLTPDSDAYKLIEAIKNFVLCMYLLNVAPLLWKYFSTPSWNLFVTNLETMTSVIRCHILAKLEELKVDFKEFYQPRSVLESILTIKKDKPMVAVTLIIDLFLAGIDTASNAGASAIYQLAKNPEKQEKLYHELKRLLPSKNSPVTWENLNELKYLKGCIKESMRISPTVPFFYRTMTKDTVLGSYRIPAGTHVLGNHLVMCNSEKNFKYANKFLPERWLKNESSSEISVKNSHPYSCLPYGFGARSCLGKRFAELELKILIAKIFRNFRVEYNHGEMIWTRRLLYGCGKTLQFKMENRPD